MLKRIYHRILAFFAWLCTREELAEQPLDAPRCNAGGLPKWVGWLMRRETLGEDALDAQRINAGGLPKWVGWLMRGEPLEEASPTSDAMRPRRQPIRWLLTRETLDALPPHLLPRRRRPIRFLLSRETLEEAEPFPDSTRRPGLARWLFSSEVLECGVPEDEGAGEERKG